ncbi:MAG: ABC transporter ATP-binding protein [Elusimicrobiota bacterium]
MFKSILKNIKILTAHFNRFRWNFVIMVFLDMIGNIFMSLGLLLFLPLLSELLNSVPTHNLIQNIISDFFDILRIKITVSNIALFMIGLSLVKAGFFYYSGLYEVKFTNHYRVDMIERLFASYQRLKWRHYIEQRRGYLMDYILNVPVRNMTLLTNLVSGVSAIIAMGVYMCFAFLVSWRITVFAVIFVLFSQIVYTMLLVKIKGYGQVLLRASNDLAKLVEEYLLGYKAVRTYGVARNVEEKVNNEATVRMDNIINIARLEVGYKVLANFFITFILLGLLVLFVDFLEYPLSEILVVCLFLGKLILKSRSLRVFGKVAAFMPGIQKIEDMLNEFNLNQETALVSGIKVTDLKDKIEYRNVNYTYDINNNRIKKDTVFVLNDINFYIKKGTMTGIIGSSGAGKTTILDLMLGLLSPSRGSIFIDGQPLSELNLTNWHRLIGYVPQEGFIINGTILENIAFQREISEDAAVEAARLANCNEFISSFKNGLHTHIGDSGVNLSGGERQRLCLARALAGHPKILIMDEATSAIDSRSEEYIKKALRQLKDKITIITVAHRISTIIDTDYIIVMDDGTIVEKGTREELLANNKGIFNEMYRRQNG